MALFSSGSLTCILALRGILCLITLPQQNRHLFGGHFNQLLTIGRLRSGRRF